MRHRKLAKNLDRTASERIALIRCLVKSLFVYEGIKTTITKAKVARRFAEKLITLAKNDSVAARRQAYSFLQDRAITANLFKDIAPRFKQRPGGYTRITHFSNRAGDGAQLAILELVERKIKEPPKAKKKEDVKLENAKVEEVTEKEETKTTKDESKKLSEQHAEEKKVAEKTHITKEEPHKKGVLKEGKPGKGGVMGNLRTFFRRKSIG